MSCNTEVPHHRGPGEAQELGTRCAFFEKGMSGGIFSRLGVRGEKQNIKIDRVAHGRRCRFLSIASVAAKTASLSLRSTNAPIGRDVQCRRIGDERVAFLAAIAVARSSEAKSPSALPSFR